MSKCLVKVYDENIPRRLFIVNLTDLKKAKSCIKAYILEGYVCFLVLKNKKHCISSESTWKKYFEGNSLK